MDLNERGLSSQRPRYERRQGPDVMSVAVKAMALLAWLMCTAGGLILLSAKPERVSVFDRFTGVRRFEQWDSELMNAGLTLLLLTTVTCALGLFFNLFRMRRKTDGANISLVLLGLVSVAGLVGFWLTRASG